MESKNSPGFFTRPTAMSSAGADTGVSVGCSGVSAPGLPPRWSGVTGSVFELPQLTNVAAVKPSSSAPRPFSMPLNLYVPRHTAKQRFRRRFRHAPRGRVSVERPARRVTGRVPRRAGERAFRPGLPREMLHAHADEVRRIEQEAF